MTPPSRHIGLEDLLQVQLSKIDIAWRKTDDVSDLLYDILMRQHRIMEMIRDSQIQEISPAKKQ